MLVCELSPIEVPKLRCVKRTPSQDVEAELRGRRSQAGAWERGWNEGERCFHFTVTPGRCDPRWVTLAESDFALQKRLPNPLRR